MKTDTKEHLIRLGTIQPELRPHIRAILASESPIDAFLAESMANLGPIASFNDFDINVSSIRPSKWRIGPNADMVQFDFGSGINPGWQWSSAISEFLKTNPSAKDAIFDAFLREFRRNKNKWEAEAAALVTRVVSGRSWQGLIVKSLDRKFPGQDWKMPSFGASIVTFGEPNQSNEGSMSVPLRVEIAMNPNRPLESPFKLMTKQQMDWIMDEEAADNEGWNKDGFETRESVRQDYMAAKKRLLTMDPVKAWKEALARWSHLMGNFADENPKVRDGLSTYTRLYTK